MYLIISSALDLIIVCETLANVPRMTRVLDVSNGSLPVYSGRIFCRDNLRKIRESNIKMGNKIEIKGYVTTMVNLFNCSFDVYRKTRMISK